MTEATKKAIEVLEDMESNYRNSAHFIPEYAKHADALDHALTLIRETAKEATHAAQSEWREILSEDDLPKDGRWYMWNIRGEMHYLHTYQPSDIHLPKYYVERYSHYMPIPPVKEGDK